MKTNKKNKQRSLRLKKVRTKTHSDLPLIKRKGITPELIEGNLTEEDFETLGPINLAHDLGDDEQLKYWEELAEDRPGSEMEEAYFNLDEFEQT